MRSIRPKSFKRSALTAAVPALLAMMAIGVPSAAAGTETAKAPMPAAGAACPGGFCTGQDVRLMRAEVPLDRAVARVMARPAGGLGGRPTRVVELADGSGLEVDFEHHVAAATVTAALNPGVRVITGQRPAAVPLSREADSPPYWAGALITTSLGSCTSGFGIHSIYSSSIRYLLTTRHCVHLPNDTVRTGAGVVIGPLGPDSSSLDLVVISANSGPVTYDGPAIYMSGQFPKPVVAASGNAVATCSARRGRSPGHAATSASPRPV
jgi:hypothetical protein